MQVESGSGSVGDEPRIRGHVRGGALGVVPDVVSVADGSVRVVAAGSLTGVPVHLDVLGARPAADPHRLLIHGKGVVPHGHVGQPRRTHIEDQTVNAVAVATGGAAVPEHVVLDLDIVDVATQLGDEVQALRAALPDPVTVEGDVVP